MSHHPMGSLIRSGTTSDFVAGKDGEGIKLFFEKLPHHQHEVNMARIAHQAGIPTPAVIDGLLDINDREAIVFARIDGIRLDDHINSGNADVVACAHDMATLHAEIHSRPAPENLLTSKTLVALAMPQVESLTEETKAMILDRIEALPHDNQICHNDFGPHNIVMSETGMNIVDWAMGTSGPHLSDFAHAELLSMVWMGEISGESSESNWQVFWETYREAYRQRCPYPDEDLLSWQLGAAATLLCYGLPAYQHYYLDFIQSVLG